VAVLSEVNSYADGAIVGSLFIKAYLSGGVKELSTTVTDLKSGSMQ